MNVYYGHMCVSDGYRFKTRFVRAVQDTTDNVFFELFKRKIWQNLAVCRPTG